MKGFILFGAGKIGVEALRVIGEERVYCFCDNNIKLHGTKKFDKAVISFDKLKEVLDSYIVVICANFRKTYTMAGQLEEAGIYDYVPYIDIVSHENSEKYWDKILNDIMERSHIRCSFYRNKNDELEKQINYFKRHVDISDIKPAMGDLKEYQLKEIQGLKDIIKDIKELNICPFLYAGSLLGYIRHNGFIPWDDDIDLGLIRTDYEKLREFCGKKYNILCLFPNELPREKWADFFAQHLNEWCFRENSLYLQLIKKDENDNLIVIDFFPLDYFSDDYSFSVYREYLFEEKQKLMTMNNELERIDYIKNEIRNNKNIVNKSKSLYYSPDNFAAYYLYNKGEWIYEDVIFPLNKVKFEGVDIYAPNKPEKFLEYMYTDIYGYPDDVGLLKHYNED